MSSHNGARSVAITLTPVGGSVRVEVPGPYKARPWASMFWLTGSKLDLRVNTGTPGSCADAVADMGEPNARYSFRHAGGDVEVVQTGQGLAAVAWSGGHHEFYYYLRNNDIDIQDVGGLLSALDLSDSADGLVVRPRRGHGLRARRLAMFTWFEGLMTVDIYHMSHLRLLPKWRGMKAASGELWRESDQKFLLGTPTAVAALGPDEGQVQATADAAVAMTADYSGVDISADE